MSKRTRRIRRTSAIAPLEHDPAPQPPALPSGGVALKSSAGLLAGHPLERRTTAVVDGIRLVVRPVLPSDAPAIVRFVADLSPTSRYRRFHAPLRRLSSAQLAGIVDVDHHERETLVVLAPDGAGERLVAVGQLVAVDDEPGARDAAEIALVVADDWQGRGLGTVLTRRLAAVARDEGRARLVATVLAEHPAVHRLAHRIAPSVDVTWAGTTNRLVVPLVVDEAVPAPQPGAVRAHVGAA